jgi:dipeptidyl aminopeptidase/acylaminoacyl peptidase
MVVWPRGPLSRRAADRHRLGSRATIGLIVFSLHPQLQHEEYAEMQTGKRKRSVALILTVLNLIAGVSASSLFAQMGRRGLPMTGVYKWRITANWFDGDARFWYRNDLKSGDREFILVNADEGTRQAAFDHQKLAASLSKASGEKYAANRLPFDGIEFVDEGKSIKFKVKETTWKCDLATYECTKTEEGGAALPPAPSAVAAAEPAMQTLEELTSPADLSSPYQQQAQDIREKNQGEDDDRPIERRELIRSVPSPDGKWTAFIKDDNVYVRTEDGGKEFQLSRDGKPGLGYGMLRWAPDSQTLTAFRIEPGDNKDVYLIESSPRAGGRAVLHTRHYDLPGDKLASFELNLFNPGEQKQIKPEVDRIDFGVPRLRWNSDGHRFTYEKSDRGHQRFRLIEVDARTGQARNIIDEKTDTFIWTAHTEMVNIRLVNYLDRSDEIIYVSEKDGWRHMYLIDAKTGETKDQITQGEWIVRGIDRIDQDSRQVWFRASGVYAGQDPYLVHYGRVNFDGSGLVFLTAGDGNHAIAYSPNRKYIIDSYSRVDMAPVHELRRVADGSLVCELEKADDSELRATGWMAPEVFAAKGRDGVTDIWGIIRRPQNLDPVKKYPVIEQIYAGPQGSFVPKTFAPSPRGGGSFTDLGFIVAQIDGMGTANRSKKFHDVCWKNLKDAGFPDRILWHQAVAKKYPYYDISRMGIIGTSAGGQSAAGALLFHPEFYKVAVANSGCHDNRMDKASWNEQWMGYPVGPQYAESSNITHAGNLQGHLMLIVGEMDTNVPPESTLRFADALIKARKDFDLIFVPGAGHGAGGPYVQRRVQDFFLRHLQGIDPPDRNGAFSQPSAN